MEYAFERVFLYAGTEQASDCVIIACGHFAL
jgi:hypothetical protein